MILSAASHAKLKNIDTEMWDLLRSRHNTVSVIFLLYLLPVLIICSLSLFFSSWLSSWAIFSVGLLLAAGGAIAFFSVLLFDDPPVPPKIDTPVVEELENVPNPEEMQCLYAEVDTLELSVQQLRKDLDNANTRNEGLLKEAEHLKKEVRNVQSEKDHYLLELEKLDKDFQELKESSEKALDEERTHHQEALKTISELRSSIDIKQRQNELLDQKINDLKYEIKTLLQIADMTSSIMNEINEDDSGGTIVNETAGDYQVSIEQDAEKESEHDLGQVHSPDEAKIQLKRCVDIAQKITGSQHFATHKSRFGDLALDNYALDLRRLCDNLRSENNSTVFVFSPKDRKLLFINNQVRQLLGWTPDKFVQDFDHIVQEGMFEWNSSISQLNTFNQSQTRFVMRTKSGEDLLVHCQLGLIPTGVFRNNVIGILYPA